VSTTLFAGVVDTGEITGLNIDRLLFPLIKQLIKKLSYCFSICSYCHRNRDEQKSAISLHDFEKIPLEKNPIIGDKRETDA
jgi:hypothetical protein